MNHVEKSHSSNNYPQDLPEYSAAIELMLIDEYIDWVNALEDKRERNRRITEVSVNPDESIEFLIDLDPGENFILVEALPRNAATENRLQLGRRRTPDGRFLAIDSQRKITALAPDCLVITRR